MNRRRFVLGMCLLAGQASAGEWKTLDGAAIDALLNDTRVAYSGAWQEFYASGKTLYNAGRDSWGLWRIEGALYCSEWPPNAGWDCYAMTQRGAAIRFIDAKGNVTEGQIEPLN
ncbi:MAG: hypothetical protein AAF198_08685 [Pseudomonadota bacterium]